MNKLRLSALLLFSALAVFIIQSCNKDTVTAVAYTTAPFQANIDGAVWAPKLDSVTTTVTYSSDGQTKTLYCIATKNTKQVIFSVTLPNTNTSGFPVGTYNIDASKITAQYNTQQLSGSNYVFMQQGTVGPNAGIITVTAVDSVKKQITGTFGFYSRSTVYDGSGNVISTTVDNITGGTFTTIPYTFTSN